LFELESIRARIYARDVESALHLLDRVHVIERVLIAQIPVLESMSPQDFLEFRIHLAPASGFQSIGFRAVEFISGVKDRRYLARLSASPERDHLERLLDEPTLWDAFCDLLESKGMSMPPHDETTRRNSLLTMAMDRIAHAAEFRLSEALLTHDELFTQWRVHHVLMVERQIGSKTGTGGSTGASYLRSTIDKRFYPELWALRSYLTERREGREENGAERQET
jgi:tryptophan 2,3-dioxygenase